MAEQLLEQLSWSVGLSVKDREVGEYIIGNLDERGFLCCSIEDVANDLVVDLGQVENVLSVIQTFKPIGIAARDVRESLMIQLEMVDVPLASLATSIVRDFMDDLIHRRLTRITRGLGISNEELKKAIQIIENLQPYPGSLVDGDYNGLLTLDAEVTYITPDLIVVKGEEWVVSLVDGSLPALRINSQYADLLQKPQNIAGHRSKIICFKKFE